MISVWGHKILCFCPKPPKFQTLVPTKISYLKVARSKVSFTPERMLSVEKPNPTNLSYTSGLGWNSRNTIYQSFAVYCQPFWSCGFLHCSIPSYLLETEHQQNNCRFGHVYSHCNCDVVLETVCIFLDFIVYSKPSHAKLISILYTGCLSVTPPPTVSTMYSPLLWHHQIAQNHIITRWALRSCVSVHVCIIV